jgi:hypothetical protein
MNDWPILAQLLVSGVSLYTLRQALVCLGQTVAEIRSGGKVRYPFQSRAEINKASHFTTTALSICIEQLKFPTTVLCMIYIVHAVSKR